eukprot:TRINITY_DN94637_c0_g1_i1.p1 TRINITY_DN94637_c0_g1~~TRINITY_DN94637_c0_g1_i1.p1  ORF type:complete len:414 (+),score=58.35 TRINITY_DN94637_c0_g1_i1:82-1242(+)
MQRWFNSAYNWIWFARGDAEDIAESAPNAESASEWIWVAGEFARGVLAHPSNAECRARLNELTDQLDGKLGPGRAAQDEALASMKSWFRLAYDWVWTGLVDTSAEVSPLLKDVPHVGKAMDWLWAAGDFVRVVLTHDRDPKYRIEKLQFELRQKDLGSRTSNLLSERQELLELQKKAKAMQLEIKFRESFANTYADTLKFEVLSCQMLEPSPEKLEALQAFRATQTPPCEEEYVYHCAPVDVIPHIIRDGLRPSHCAFCRGLGGAPCGDSGWFGDHSKGVYVSKHADYTSKYFRSPPVSPGDGDIGRTVMFKTLPGRKRRFHAIDERAQPDCNFDCHVSPNGLEYFIYDTATQAEPPRHASRCVPVAVIHWRAVSARYVGITDDGA